MTHDIYKSCSNNELTASMITPGVVGGFPMIFYHNMHVRAESDLLGPFISIYQHCLNADPSVAHILERFFRFPETKPQTIVGLLKDPYSIPLKRPTLPSTHLRAQIVPALQILTKHEDIRKLLDLVNSPIPEQVYQLLIYS